MDEEFFLSCLTGMMFRLKKNGGISIMIVIFWIITSLIWMWSAIIIDSVFHILFSLIYFIGGIFVFWLIGKLEEKKKAAEEAKKQHQKAAEEAKQQHQNKCEVIYQMCCERGVYECETPENERMILLAAKNHGVSDRDEAIAAFNEGKQLNHRKQAAERAAEQKKKQERLDFERKIHNSKYQKQKSVVSFIGKAKYFAPHAVKLEEIKEYLNAVAANKSGRPYKYATAKKEDWSIIGGLASGIAGPAAGVAAAVAAQNRNAQREASVRAYNEAVATLNVLHMLRASAPRYTDGTLEGYEEYCHWFHDKLNTVLVDDENQNELSAGISLTVVETKVEETGYMMLTVESSLREQKTIFGKAATADGYYRIEVFANDRYIGDAYYSPYGAGESNLTIAGFSSKEKRNVMAKPKPGESFSAQENYVYNFVPLTLWAIEAVHINGFYSYKSNVMKEIDETIKAANA